MTHTAEVIITDSQLSKIKKLKEMHRTQDERENNITGEICEGELGAENALQPGNQNFMDVDQKFNSEVLTENGSLDDRLTDDRQLDSNPCDKEKILILENDPDRLKSAPETGNPIHINGSASRAEACVGATGCDALTHAELRLSYDLVPHSEQSSSAVKCGHIDHAGYFGCNPAQEVLTVATQSEKKENCDDSLAAVYLSRSSRQSESSGNKGDHNIRYHWEALGAVAEISGFSIAGINTDRHLMPCVSIGKQVVDEEGRGLGKRWHHDKEICGGGAETSTASHSSNDGKQDDSGSCLNQQNSQRDRAELVDTSHSRIHHPVPSHCGDHITPGNGETGVENSGLHHSARAESGADDGDIKPCIRREESGDTKHGITEAPGTSEILQIEDSHAAANGAHVNAVSVKTVGDVVKCASVSGISVENTAAGDEKAKGCAATKIFQRRRKRLKSGLDGTTLQKNTPEGAMKKEEDADLREKDDSCRPTAMDLDNRELAPHRSAQPALNVERGHGSRLAPAVLGNEGTGDIREQNPEPGSVDRAGSGEMMVESAADEKPSVSGQGTEAGSAEDGALWDIFRREDGEKLQAYLRRHCREFRHLHCCPIEQVSPEPLPLL